MSLMIQNQREGRPSPGRIACWTGALLLLFIFAVPAHAQFGASLAGTVLDQTGAAISQATVTLTNEGTQEIQTSTTNDTGAYHFNELAPGQYSVVVAAAGFKTNTVTDLALAAETPRNVNVTLQTGTATESVQVNGDLVPLLQTANASIGTTIDSEDIQRLPTFGADPYELLRTAPGITGDGARSGTGQAVFLPNGAGPGGSNSGIFQTENQVQIAAAGQRQADNNFMVDGVSVNSLTHGGSAVVSPSEEAVGEMTVVSTSYDASDGRNSGAQIKIVTKTGSDNLHGSLFGLYDEAGLNAYNKWGGPSGALPTVVDNDQRSYAASLGGPVLHKKIFFFLSWAGFTTANNSEILSYVETPSYRAAVIANRAGGVSAGILGDPNVAPRIRTILTPSCAGLTAGTNCNVVSGGLDIGSLTPGGASQIGVFPANTQLGGGLDGIADVENAQLYVPAHSRGNQFNG
ncbi:MAG: TonB-dependent receptor, partial [Terracidiphilus sp.]